jgi:hypothetical protein
MKTDGRTFKAEKQQMNQPMVGVELVCLRNSKEATVATAQ